MFDTVLCEFNFGYLPEDRLMTSMRCYASEVMPALRDLEPLAQPHIRATGR